MTTRFLVLGLALGVLALGAVWTQSGCLPHSAELAQAADTQLPYPVVDTGQTACYDDVHEIVCPAAGSAFYGQDVQFAGNAPSYTDNGDGTVMDNITDLMWQQTPDRNGDGDINVSDKLTYAAAGTYCQDLMLAGHTDWRLPDIKTLYSLIDFRGLDPSGYQGSDTSGLIPFIDTDFFAFGYGDTDAGERVIDAQFASSTLYVADNNMMFGVNFADGRIKGYGLTMPGPGSVEKTFYVLCVRGDTDYGQNAFSNNGDETITDSATGLMWAQDDSGAGLNWEAALAWVETQNAANYLGYNDWRLPNVKELQSIVDYSRSPDTTDAAALSPLFNATAITNEAGATDYPFYWSSTTHANWTQTPGAAGAYVAFGRALGYMNQTWIDVHGAGAQRSDPKQGNPADYPTGRGPQGDAIRIYNTVRLVRDAEASPTPTVAPLPTLEPLDHKVYIPLALKGNNATSTPTYTLEKTLSDGAQRNTIAFDALAFLTGDLGVDSFFPPGKVADFWGFQYLRDNDTSEMGHAGDFLTRAALNMLTVLTPAQRAELITLAKGQVEDIAQYGYDRFVLMDAFCCLLEGDLPTGATGLDADAVQAASAELYRLDGEISYERAQVMGAMISAFTAEQRAYLDAMVGQGMRTWPDVPEPGDLRSLERDAKVAVMTYAGDMFSWYTGSVEAEVFSARSDRGPTLARST